MEPQIIGKLLEKISKKQYTEIIRSFSLHNKRMRIPGFTSMEKVPLTLIANNAKTNKVFRKALLDEISTIILAGAKINMEDDINQIKSTLPKEKLLGFAALLLFLENENYVAEAERIITDFAVDAPQVVVSHETPDNSRSDKKEEKFREKYLKAKKEVAELQTKYDESQDLYRKISDEANRLEETIKELESQCAIYLSQIQSLSNERLTLCAELEKSQVASASTQYTSSPKITPQILAPCCEDILGRYCEIITINFEDATKIPKESILEKYNEIWVFPDVLPFSMYRMFCKWKKEAEGQILIFQTATELLAHADALR